MSHHAAIVVVSPLPTIPNSLRLTVSKLPVEEDDVVPVPTTLPLNVRAPDAFVPKSSSTSSLLCLCASDTAASMFSTVLDGLSANDPQSDTPATLLPPNNMFPDASSVILSIVDMLLCVCVCPTDFSISVAVTRGLPLMSSHAVVVYTGVEPPVDVPPMYAANSFALRDDTMRFSLIPAMIVFIALSSPSSTSKVLKSLVAAKSLTKKNGLRDVNFICKEIIFYPIAIMVIVFRS